MKHLAIATLLACASPRAPDVTARVQAVAQPSGLTVLRVLADADGLGIRGAGAELAGRIYWTAGERGPNGTPACSSGAHWNDLEHTHHCPGALVSIALDGSAFRVDYAFSRLDDVTSQNADGYHPYGSPVADTTGCLVGVAQAGGTPLGDPGEVAPGFGTLWRYCPASSAFTVLHTFFALARALDGEYPMGSPAVLPDGRICGTSKGGGALGMGTVWCWSPSGAFAYAPLTDATGADSYGGALYSGGLLHLTTSDGAANGAGAYVVADPATLALTVVQAFDAFAYNDHGSDNTSIQAPTQLSNGAIVMARQYAGAFGTGIVVGLSPRTGITPMQAFDDIPLAATPRFANLTGGMPNGRVTEAPSGLIVGTTEYGGAYGAGSIYELARDGTRSRLLYSFDPAGPSYPYGGLMTASNGAVYGATFDAGALFSFVAPIEACP
jgi:uncharacterized repeat protein (TIGR03803 family)